VAAYELGGKDVTLRIKSVTSESVDSNKGDKKRKVIIAFDGAKKPFLSNTTNNKTIASLYGTDTSGWVGKYVTLYPTTTSAFGEVVDCLRVRPVAGVASAAAE
jgi:hypothetical protein